MKSLTDEAAGIADCFLSARRAAAGLADFPGVLPATLDEAYAVQDAAIAAWGRPVIGWKVGRINPPDSERYGTDRLTGPIFRSALAGPLGAGPDMPVFARGFAAGEAEFLLRIGKAPPPGQRDFTLDGAADLIGAVHVGIEVASSPLVAINDFGPTAVISDFGNNNGILIGRPIPEWRSSGFEDWTVTTRIDGREVGTGRAADFPDGAIGAARFLIETLARRGIALQPGQWISSGAVTGVHEAAAGQRIEARFDGDFAIACTLVAAAGE